MIELQVLSKVLTSQSTSLLDYNGITDDFFIAYVNEYNFIKQHIEEYGAVPDPETFMEVFPDFTLLDVREPDKYLVQKFHEEHAYNVAVPIMYQLMDILKSDANSAFEFLQSKLSVLQPYTPMVGVDIVKQAKDRYKAWLDRRSNPNKYFMSTGLEQLDAIFLGGWQRGEDFIVLFSRTGEGKTYMLVYFLKSAWQQGYRVGLVEPEMTANKLGYRFDTLVSNFSNTALVKGSEVDGYIEYIDELSQCDVPFFVAHPVDFKRKVTVSKLRSWAISQKLDILAIDGISYLTDERQEKGDNRTTQLTHISEDLMSLSIELGIPVIVVAQSNRDGASDGNAPELENIRDSDGIAYNASKVLAIKSKENFSDVYIRKNREQKTGQKLSYFWNPDLGVYKFVANIDSKSDDTDEAVRANRSAYKNGSEVF